MMQGARYAEKKRAGWKDPDDVTALPHQPQAASSRLLVTRKIKPQLLLQVAVLKSSTPFLKQEATNAPSICPSHGIK